MTNPHRDKLPETSTTVDQLKLFNTPQTHLTSDDFYTPEWIFDALGIRFTIDVASPPGGCPWIPADHHYSQHDDGLTQAWHGTVWMNPPFSKWLPWAEKWLAHGDGLALTQMSKSQSFDRMWNDRRVSCAALPPTLKFVQGPIYMPTMLWAIGETATTALHNAQTPHTWTVR